MNPAADWVRRYRPPSAGQRPLVCFPPAGAAASFFQGLARAAPAAVDPWALSLPGREARIGEPAIERMDALADATADALLRLLADARPPAILFGHSMGASLAFEVARRIEAVRPDAVGHVVVSGRAGPRGQWAYPEAAPPTDDELVAALRMLGGTPEELLAEPDMLELLLPPLRSDYRLLLDYRPRLDPPLRSGITAIAGDEDPSVGPGELASWAEVTAGPFATATVRGGHVYVADRVDEAAALIAEVAEALQRRPGSL